MEITEIVTEPTDEAIIETKIDESVVEDAEASAHSELEAEATDVLSELCVGYPEITPENAAELCNLDRYRELRALGLNVDEAYRATAKQRSATDNRAHLSVSVGGGGAPVSHGISEPELRSAREIFSGMSDAEIRRLYKRVT